MAEKPPRWALATVGTAIIGAGALLIYNLFFRPKPTVQVALNSNPIRTVLLIDDKIEVVTPKTIPLTKGRHKFAATPKSPDLMLTYGFDKWTINRQVASYEPTIEINITKPTTLIANYLVIESGVYPIVAI